MILALILLASFLPGPVEAEVVRILDGDTVEVQAQTWIDTQVTTMVRVSGIDTPEKGWRGKCEAERELGRKADALVRSLLEPGSPVRLLDVQKGKYAGRVVAVLILPDGRSLGEVLIERELAYPYDGGTKRSFCGG